MAKTYFVELGSMLSGDYERLAWCVLREDGSVQIDGPDQKLVSTLSKGVPDMDAELILPSQGYDFLRAVTRSFNNASILASPIQEGAPPMA